MRFPTRILSVALPVFFSLAACGGCNDEESRAEVCGAVECGANATCVDDLCQCAPGFEGDGIACTQITVACESDETCGESGTCNEGFCSCADGYALMQTGCADADECAANTDDCADSATCTNTPGGFTCSCPGGSGDGRTCEAFDECAAGADDCEGDHAVCVDLEDGFECACETGFTGDGETCSVLVDCNADPDACDPNASCTDTADGTACVCDEGYAGDGTTCRQTGFTTLTADEGTVCGLRPDRTMACWGWNVPGADSNELLYGVPRPKAGPEGATWTALDVSPGDVCGVRDDGTIWCTGRVGTAQVGTDTDWVDVKSGNDAIRAHYCALKADDTLWCWGSNSHGQVGVGGTEDVAEPTQIGTATWSHFDVGHARSCGVQQDRTLWCWGGAGIFGDEIWSETPLQVGGDTDWASVNIQGTSNIALKQDGSGFGWAFHEPMPESLGVEKWTSFVRGDYVDCGVKTDSTLWCKGTNVFGQLGVEGVLTSQTFVQLGGAADWTKVVRGNGFYCALKADGDAYCWGRNRRGEPGTGKLPVALEPTPIAPGVTHNAFALSLNHSCGIRSNGALACSGDNALSGVGLPTSEVAGLRFPQVADAGPWDDVAVGGAHTCALKSGAVYCFGASQVGQTGLGQGALSTHTPMQVGTDTDWSAVVAGSGSTCALKPDGALYCWGQNHMGQLGVGDTETRYEPVRVGTDSWQSIHLTGGIGEHICGIKASDQSLWCWGSNVGGELGTGDTTSSPSPVQVDAGAWQSVTVTYQATIGVKADGTLWWWGSLVALAGDSTPVLTPAQIGADTDWAKVAASNQHACAIKTDGSLYCWGQQYGGATGQPVVENAPLQEPTRVGTGSDWEEVFASRQTTCALQSSGALYCWGLDSVGQLGLGDAWYPTPQRVRD